MRPGMHLRALVRANDDIVARIGGDEFALQLIFSWGIVECAGGDTVESLLERADAALYGATRLGRNRVVSKVKPTLRDRLQS